MVKLDTRTLYKLEINNTVVEFFQEDFDLLRAELNRLSPTFKSITIDATPQHLINLCQNPGSGSSSAFQGATQFTKEVQSAIGATVPNNSMTFGPPQVGTLV